MNDQSPRWIGSAVDGVLVAQVASVPLAVAPALLFHFDVTPKLLLLLAGASIAALLLSRARAEEGLDALTSTRSGRVFLLCLAASSVSLAASTAASIDPDLSLSGTGWRRFGLVGQLAVLASAGCLACRCAANPALERNVLRALAIPGMAAALLAVGQYLGFDPLLWEESTRELFTAAGLRPYATMGHAVYLATYLSMALFAGLALSQRESGGWKVAAVAAVGLCGGGLLLTGTRGALLGTVAGLAAWGVWDRKDIQWRRMWRMAAVAGGVVLLFALTPAGARWRQRVGEWGGDAGGGTRPRLWSDCLRMAGANPLTGYGPETFSLEFPLYQSDELARDYPDVFHESPHNILLDVVLSQGVPGLAVLALTVAVAFRAAKERTPVRAMLVGSLVAQQFACFTLATAYLLYVNMALLAPPRSLPVAAAKTRRLWRRMLTKMRALEIAAAGSLVAAGHFLVSDGGLAETKRLIDRGQLAEAVAEYEDASDLYFPQTGADLWFSRALAFGARSTAAGPVPEYAWREAKKAGRRAAMVSEVRHGAWYHLATLYAVDNDARAMEASLRESIAAAPAWFKPHWMLARLLSAQGRWEKAEAAAQRAAGLAGGKYSEVEETLRTIRTSREARIIK